MADTDDKGLIPIGDILPKLAQVQKLKPPTPIQERLLSMPAQATTTNSFFEQTNPIWNEAWPDRPRQLHTYTITLEPTDGGSETD